MAKAGGEVSRSEWILMDALWQLERGTATDLQRQLQSTQGWAYSTVKTMLDRLVEKGHVKARRVGNVYEYSPKMRRPTAVNRVIDDLAEQLLGGSVAPLIQRLIEQRRLTAEEASELRSLLDDYVKKGGK
jgi:BlaI family transcriptional regulator, penicillinase repressor